MRWIRWFSEIGLGDLSLVGGKNASLGEMRRALGALGVPVPDGFAVTAEAFRHFLDANALGDRIATILAGRQRDDVATLEAASQAIRELVLAGRMPG